MLLVLCGALTLVTIDAGTGRPLLMGTILVIGLGHGLITPSVMAAAYQGLPRASIPGATTGANILIRLGGSLRTAALAIILQLAIRASVPGATGNLRQAATLHTPELPTQLTAAFTQTFWWAAGLAALSLLPVLTLPRRSKASTS
ncbi:hypothetical protein Acsp03_70640 [Actinomadura sp. NBRC 104412]|uniref:hypothetical protein n=1 Tax=Actinomadura sp. NBRC 104412 TaxID=3032203 RepID=UPI0024A13F56|nr:hypothetical protein [Actinomadura sp. NBRC 104412]GLZ09598.1 hypothetical protein Acsp03_70640 [Actinomadura sp. NBRC 104412]